MIQHRCWLCDQVMIPGRPAPSCVLGRCDPRAARRVETRHPSRAGGAR